MRDKYIKFPENIAELNKVTTSYESVGFPGACGSMDASMSSGQSVLSGITIKPRERRDIQRSLFSASPTTTGAFSASTVPSLDLIMTDSNVAKIRYGLFKDVWWRYYDCKGMVRHERGVYLICDNEYLRWPQTIPPFIGKPSSMVEGYFSSNLESVRKDVECMFGILKKHWKILNSGFLYRNIKVCKMIFIMCACLHNFLADDAVRYNVRVGRGYPIGNDGIWLSGPSVIVDNETGHFLVTKFGKCWSILANHLCVFHQVGGFPE